MTDNLVELTSDVVASFVTGNRIDTSELPGLIRSVFQTLSTLGQEPVQAAVADKPTAAQIRKSITPDALISFVDGKSYKTLKRHLTTHGMTLGDYRAKYGLPKDYPSVAPNYSLARSAMAKSLGLGQIRGVLKDRPEAEPRPRGRPKKTEA